jgi:hypothetical protein
MGGLNFIKGLGTVNKSHTCVADYKVYFPQTRWCYLKLVLQLLLPNYCCLYIRLPFYSPMLFQSMEVCKLYKPDNNERTFSRKNSPTLHIVEDRTAVLIRIVKFLRAFTVSTCFLWPYRGIYKKRKAVCGSQLQSILIGISSGNQTCYFIAL